VPLKRKGENRPRCAISGTLLKKKLFTSVPSIKPWFHLRFHHEQITLRFHLPVAPRVMF
jgi:hypothetical protein